MYMSQCLYKHTGQDVNVAVRGWQVTVFLSTRWVLGIKLRPLCLVANTLTGRSRPSCHSHPNFQLSFSVKVPCLYVRNNLKTHNSFEKPHMEILSSKHLTSFKTQKKQTGLFFSQASITVFTICKTLLKHRFCLLLFLAFIYIPPISKQMEGS